LFQIANILFSVIEDEEHGTNSIEHQILDEI